MSYCDVCGDLYRVEAATGAAAEKGTEGLVAVCTSCGKVENVVKVGDKIKVKVINVDDSGRIKLSRKALLKDEEKAEEAETADA